MILCAQDLIWLKVDPKAIKDADEKKDLYDYLNKARDVIVRAKGEKRREE